MEEEDELALSVLVSDLRRLLSLEKYIVVGFVVVVYSGIGVQLDCDHDVLELVVFQVIHDSDRGWGPGDYLYRWHGGLSTGLSWAHARKTRSPRRWVRQRGRILDDRRRLGGDRAEVRRR